MQIKHYLVLASAILTLQLSAQTFTNNTALLPQTSFSGGCTGVADMDGDGLDDMIILHQSKHLYIAYQESNGDYTLFSYGTVSGSSQWGMCAADAANDGHKDIISGGSNDGVHYVNITGRGASSMANLDNSQMFLQGVNFADIDNDGWLDAFGCHDVSLSRIWQNDQSGNLNFTLNLIDLTDYALGVNTDHSGNYGSVWSDFDDDGDIDLLIAKCRQGINNVNDPRRINQLWVNDGNGNYSEDALARGLVLYEQSWTGDFGDYDNDGDFDCLITTHSNTLTLLQNDGNNNYTDVTDIAGIGDQAFFLQAKMVDFDNDGFLDIMYSGGSHAYFHNEGDGTFTRFTNKFPYADVMHSFGIGDLNNDGFLDVYSSYGNSYVTPSTVNPDQLWLNDGNANNWISFDLTGFVSNLDAVGAKVKIYGPWGVQVREIRAGESYGITNTFKCHFGIGAAEAVTSVEIQWPSGFVSSISNPEINVVHDILEAPCQVNGIEISSNGPAELCPGEFVLLTAPPGFENYIWTGGSIGQTLEVTETGNYSVTVTDLNGCLGLSNFIQVALFESVAPEITLNGTDFFCSSESAVLNSTAGESYLWSNGDQAQSIETNISGDYFVEVTDICNVALQSNTISITVLQSGGDPLVGDEVIPGPGQATFTGSAENLHWYLNENDLSPTATGISYQTPVINQTTNFWVQEVAQYPGIEVSGGKVNQGTGAHHSNSQNWQLFDVHQDIILKQVKVFANGSGNRTIQVIDSQGNEVEVGTFNIPNGTSYVNLDFFIPAGINYGIRTTNANPQLWRDAPPTAMSYPYNIGGLATITRSSIVGNNATAYYYFFYDWQIESVSYDCPGEKYQVTAFVGVAGCMDANACNYNVNATSDDGSCNYSCFGCTDIGACNYDANASIDDGSCEFLSCSGCTDELACNYTPGATLDDGSCDYGCNDCPADFNGNNVIGADDLLILLSEYGCALPEVCNTDINGDGYVNSSDLLSFLASYGTNCD